MSWTLIIFNYLVPNSVATKRLNITYIPSAVYPEQIIIIEPIENLDICGTLYSILIATYITYYCLTLLNEDLASINKVLNSAYKEELQIISRQKVQFWGFIHDVRDLHFEGSVARSELNSLLSTHSISKVVKSLPNLSKCDFTNLLLEAGVYQQDVQELVQWLLTLR